MKHNSNDENTKLFMEAEKLREQAKKDVRRMMRNDDDEKRAKRDGSTFYNVRYS